MLNGKGEDVTEKEIICSTTFKRCVVTSYFQPLTIIQQRQRSL